MAYEKPELFTLSLASSTVRSGDSNPEVTDTKQSSVVESAIEDSGQPLPTTSSASGAYEADE